MGGGCEVKRTLVSQPMNQFVPIIDFRILEIFANFSGMSVKRETEV